MRTLPVPSGPVARLWHSATVLREHHGDGHVAALVGARVTVRRPTCSTRWSRSSNPSPRRWWPRVRGEFGAAGEPPREDRCRCARPLRGRAQPVRVRRTGRA
ncbi:helix-turn-helix domain-containing protein [Streptomyces sp. IBSBF 2806]|uniref:helix-turn-helix domain-containing protein n=1 Tax=Streptomyces sp. IBSBF 2806 TaxID=2903529 RepID=UPI003FA6A580